MSSVSFGGRAVPDVHANIVPLVNLPSSLGAQPCVVGIDEAGRGPVLGPLVYSLFAAPRELHDALRTVHRANDSKVLAHDARLQFALKMASRDETHRRTFGWCMRLVTPECISEGMLRKPVMYNLNEMSFDAVYAIIEQLLAVTTDIEHVYVDTLGAPEKYTERLSRRFPSLRFTVKSRADALYPVVSAASIMAKVTRDYELAMWPHRNPHLICEGDADVGTGYPSDPVTKAWLERNVRRAGASGLPASLVRYSWATVGNLYAKYGVSWPAVEEPKTKGRKRPSDDGDALRWAGLKASAACTVSAVPVASTVSAVSVTSTVSDVSVTSTVSAASAAPAAPPPHQ